MSPYTILPETGLKNDKSPDENKTYQDTKLVHGALYNLMLKVFTNLNSTMKLYKRNDGAFGVIKNGKWNGMLGDLIYGNIDLILAPLLLTKDRVEFTRFLTGLVSPDREVVYVNANESR